MIPAPPDAVWAVLTDFDSYSEWNPLNVEARGKAAAGARIPMTFVNPARAGAKVKLPVRLTHVEPGRRLEWIGEIPVLFRGRHFFDLSPDGGGTRMVHGEDMSGMISWGISARQIEQDFIPVYQAMNAALAARAARRT